MKLTPWFRKRIKPVHEGVYMIRFADEFPRSRVEMYAYWNGVRWGWANSDIDEANRQRDWLGAQQSKEWRGLAEKPENTK